MAVDGTLAPIPRWLEPRDDDKPYIEIVHGRRERKMSPNGLTGCCKVASFAGSTTGPRGAVR